MRKTGFLVLIVTGVCFLLAACGGGGDGSSTAASSPIPPATTATTMDHTASPSTGDSVAIKDFAYGPADLTVAKGTRLIFSNEDSTPHTATSADAGGFDTGPIQKDQTKSVTLEQPGTYSYICSFHPFMHGTVTVQP